MSDPQNPFQPPVPAAAVSQIQGPSPGGSLDFGRALRFFFEDPDWVKKMLIGSLIVLASFLIIPMVFLMGYYLRVMKRTANGETLPLPEWDDWGGLAVDGLAAFGVQLGYMIPAYLILLVPVAIGAAMGEDSSAGGVLIALGLVFAFLVIFIVAMAMPAALVRLATQERFGAAFEIGENISFISRNIGNYLMAIILMLLANVIAQFGILVFCVGLLPASFWAMCLMGYGFGEVAYRDRGA